MVVRGRRMTAKKHDSYILQSWRIKQNTFQIVTKYHIYIFSNYKLKSRKSVRHPQNTNQKSTCVTLALTNNVENLLFR